MINLCRFIQTIPFVVLSLLVASMAAAGCASSGAALRRCVDRNMGPGFMTAVAEAEAVLLDEGLLKAPTLDGYLDLQNRVSHGRVPFGAGCAEVERRTGTPCWVFGAPSAYASFEVCLAEAGLPPDTLGTDPYVVSRLAAMTDEQVRDVRFRSAVIAALVAGLGTRDVTPQARPDTTQMP